MALIGGLFLARAWIARTALANWLGSKGIQSDVQISRIGLDRLSGRVLAGPRSTPDFSAEDIDVRYRLTQWNFWKPGGLEVASIELTKPVLRARLTAAGKLSFGSLDPVIDELLARPPDPDSPKPLVVLRQATVRIDTPYGQAIALGDLRIADGRLRRLAARLEPTTLNVGGRKAVIESLRIDASSTGDEATAAVQARIRQASGPLGAIESLTLNLSAQGPYPDMERKRADGPLRVSLNAAANRLTWKSGAATGPAITATYGGRIQGWGQTLRLLGSGKAQIGVADARHGDVAAGASLVRADAPALDISPLRQEMAGDDLNLDLETTRISAQDLTLTAVRGRFKGKAAMKNHKAEGALEGDLAARGRYARLGPVKAGEPPMFAQLRRALADFSVRAPALAASTADGGSLRLISPARLQSASGAVVTIASFGQGPLYAQNAGAARITLAGGGLPDARADIANYRVTPAGVTARASLEASGDFAPADNVVLKAAGDVRVAGSTTEITLSRCADVTADSIDFAENDLTAVKGQLCANGAPTLALGPAGWRMRARLADVGAALPSAALQIQDAAGIVQATGGRTLAATLDLTTARLLDTGADRRFSPLVGAGFVRLAGDQAVGEISLADLKGAVLGKVDFTHALSSGAGQARVDTGELAFAQGGLQPAELSPLAAVIASPVTGKARFSGVIDWSAQGLATRGELSIPRLDFKSSAGEVRGLKGVIALSSLAPLTAPPGQTLTIDSLQGPLPITALKATFGLAGDEVRVEAASAAIGGGTVSVGPTTVPFDQTTTWETVLLVDRVQLSDIVEKSGFADKLKLSAKVSGRAPLTIGPGGVRVVQGYLTAVESGHLSLKREALTQVSAGGGPQTPDAPPNLAADFAYQAMENLDFETLSAEINSLPAGRLGVLFKVKGEYAPPKAQDLRLGVSELLDRSFLNRTLPLPSGTKVDLTLDTSLNADELLSDVVNLRGGGSPMVQPTQ